MNLVAVRTGQQQHLVARAAQDKVKVVENVAAKDAEVCRHWIGESGKIPTDSGSATIVTCQFQHGLDLKEGLCPAYSRQGQSYWRRSLRTWEPTQECGTEDGLV